jgi:hypothetical protein
LGETNPHESESQYIELNPNRTMRAMIASSAWSERTKAARVHSQPPFSVYRCVGSGLSSRAQTAHRVVVIGLEQPPERQRYHLLRGSNLSFRRPRRCKGFSTDGSAVQQRGRPANSCTHTDSAQADRRQRMGVCLERTLRNEIPTELWFSVLREGSSAKRRARTENVCKYADLAL